MKKASGFSILIFAPLLIAFLLPALFLLPSGILMTLISIFDPALAIPQAAGCNAWMCGPIAAAASLFLIGIWFHSLYLRALSRKTVWILIWAIFSAALFVAVWLGVSILTSIGASDYPADRFYRWTAGIAALFIVAFQPGVCLWLFVSSRILRRLELAPVERKSR